jgi:hypothetical protein
MQSGARDVLRLSLPEGALCTPKDGALHLESKRRDLMDVWLIPGATTIDQGIARVPDVIAPEFKEFRSTGSTELQVAGSPAKRLSGSGVEADDGDPGTADAVVFVAGGRVFVALVHGESLSPKAREWMMSITGTAAGP